MRLISPQQFNVPTRQQKLKLELTGLWMPDNTTDKHSLVLTAQRRTGDTVEATHQANLLFFKLGSIPTGHPQRIQAVRLTGHAAPRHPGIGVSGVIRAQRIVGQ